MVWWRQPYSFLWSALYCGGRITPATVLGLRHLLKAIPASDFGGTDPTLRWAAVWWIRDVIAAALTDTDPKDARLTAARRNEQIVAHWLHNHLARERSIFEWDDNDAPGQVLLAAARVDCFDCLPECYGPLSSLLTPHSPEQLRAAAASATAMLIRHPDLHRYKEEITAYHAEEACHGSPQYRASMLIGLGELGAATSEWLTDPELAVKVCAALAPGLAEDQTATQVLRTASLDPAALDASLAGMHLHQVPQHHHTVAEALCHRVEAFEPLLDSAITAVAYETPGGVSAEPYLRKAFPHGLPIHGTTAQQTLARAIAAHDRAWQSDKRWTQALSRTGLPVEREAWLASAG
ncbi:hypothetical protein L083_4046 [Actinoplanes sp. N902-109]|nr:hypothetical protein L083_4046 [Actinoplanes sp. N902-109]